MKLKLLLAFLFLPLLAFGANTNVYDNVLIRNSFQFIGGAPGPGKVLTSDAFGYTSWTTPAAGGAQTNAVNFWTAEQRFVTPLTGFEPHGVIVTNTTTSSTGGFSGRGTTIQTMILNNNGHYLEASLNNTGTSTLTFDGFNALAATAGAQTVGSGMSTIGIGGAATVISLGTTSAAAVTFNAATASIPNNLNFGSGVLNLNNTSGVVSNSGGIVSSASMTSTNFVWTLGTQGSVLFTGAGGRVTQNNSNFFWDNTNFRFGVGTATPLASVHAVVASDNQAGSPVNLSTNMIFAADNFSNTNIPSFVGRRARGSLAAPSAIITDDALLFLNGRGYGTTLMTTSSRASIAFKASENWTDANNGTYIQFQTTPNLSSTMAERMRIDQNGNVGIGTNAPAFPLDVVGAIRSVSATSLIDSAPNNALDIYANGGAGTITNHAIASLFTGSIDAPTNTAPFITQTSVPSAINVVVQNANYRTFVNVSLNLTTAVAGSAQATLRTALSGVTQDISIASAPAGAVASYIIPITGFIQPNATYWVTNQSTGTATATFNVSRSNAL